MANCSSATDATIPNLTILLCRVFIDTLHREIVSAEMDTNDSETIMGCLPATYHHAPEFGHW
jgi:hypothetical protein